MRTHLLNILLAGTATAVALGLAAATIAAAMGSAGEPGEVRRLYLGALVILSGMAVVYLIHRRKPSSDLAGLLYLSLWLVLILVADEPRQVADGRSLFLFALPITLASVLLRPWASFAVAGMSSLLITIIASTMQPLVPGPKDQGLPPNVPAILGFFVLALVSWLSTHSMEQVVKQRRESEGRYRALVEGALEGFYLRDAETGRFLYLNQRICELFGYRMEECLRLTFQDMVAPADRELTASKARDLVQGKRVEPHTFTASRKDGSTFTAEVSPVLVTYRGKSCIQGTVRDVTERERLEAQLRQAQRMEAIGALAGGVAHDFNNLLTIIMSYANLVLAGLPPDDPLPLSGAQGLARKDVALDCHQGFSTLDIVKDVRQIRKAGKQAAELTRQLLAFSRQQTPQPRVLDLNAVVARAEKMLRRLIGEDVELVTDLAPDLGCVKADPSQVEQVLMNLVVNARDAMPQGGTLTIETANAALDEDYARLHLDAPVPGQRASGPPLVPGTGVESGSYVMMAVSDTGVGMDAETQAHIFEPFFTTKESGKGTGLGLATVYGIVTQSGGHVWVYSEPERGATFEVYLPRVEEAIEADEQGAAPVDTLRGTETILLVEDEEEVRELMCRALTRYGYTVLDAGSADEAIRLCEQHKIHLLITDVVMPQLPGPELSGQLVELRPEMKTLYVSGYPNSVIAHHGVLKPGVALLSKPFTPTTLARRVRQMLDNPS